MPKDVPPREIDVRITASERRWMINWYKELAQEAREAGRPDLAKRAMRCAGELGKKK